MSKLESRNESEILPFVVSAPSVAAIATTDGAEQTGTYTLFKTRTYASINYSYVIGTDADTITPNVVGDVDLSGFPTISAGGDYSSGEVVIRFSKNGAAITRNFLFTSSTGASYDYPTGVVAGTVLSHAHNLLFNASTAASTDDFYFRTVGGEEVAVSSGTTYLGVEKNPDCWASGWDFSGVPIHNSSSNGSQHGGMLLTRRILVEAHHFASPVGTTFKFKGTDGAIYSRVSVAVNARPTGVSDAETQHLQSVPGDLRVHLLDSDLPAVVTSYPIAGNWKRVIGAEIGPYGSYQVAKYGYYPVAGVYLDQTRRARWIGSYPTNESNIISNNAVTFEDVSVSVTMDELIFSSDYSDSPFLAAPVASGRLRMGIPGDSGSGVFYPLTSTTLAALIVFYAPWAGTNLEEARCNALIRSAYLAYGISTGFQTVTVAPDPTL